MPDMTGKLTSVMTTSKEFSLNFLERFFGVGAGDDLPLFLRQQLGGHFAHERIVLNIENFQRGWHRMPGAARESRA